MQSNVTLLGIDGGGTSSRGAILLPGGRGRVELTGGPANVSSFDGAVERLRDLAGRLMAAAAPPAGAPVVAHLGLAGVMDAAMAARVAAAMPFSRIAVTDDQPTMIAGALGGADGVVAAIGTGSFVGRQSDGLIRSVGGWGFTLGDQASGAWLGRRLLCEVMLVHDGLSSGTSLTRAVLARMGTGAEITAFSLAAAPVDFAALAPEVVSAAEAGDPFAVSLIREGAAYIEGALGVLGADPDDSLCLAGGLGPRYARWLDRPTTEARGKALDGALMLAARAAGISIGGEA